LWAQRAREREARAGRGADDRSPQTCAGSHGGDGRNRGSGAMGRRTTIGGPHLGRPAMRLIIYQASGCVGHRGASRSIGAEAERSRLGAQTWLGRFPARSRPPDASLCDPPAGRGSRMDLHPELTSDGFSRKLLPRMPAAANKLYGDVVHRSGCGDRRGRSRAAWGHRWHASRKETTQEVRGHPPRPRHIVWDRDSSPIRGPAGLVISNSNS